MGFIDVHTHGLGGFDTRGASAADIIRMAELHASSGTQAIVPTIYPSSIEDMRRDIQAVKTAMAMQGNDGPKDRQSAAILGVHLEGPFLNPVRAGALGAMHFLEPTPDNLMRLIGGFEDIIKIVTISPELGGAIRLIRDITGRGIVASMGHSDATFNEAREGFNAGARGVTHIFNAMRGFHHREPGIAGFALVEQEIFIEVIGDPFHLSRETLKFIFSIKDPGRIVLVSDTVKLSPTAGAASPVADRDGKLTGGCLPLGPIVDELLRSGYDRDIVEAAARENPARYLGVPQQSR